MVSAGDSRATTTAPTTAFPLGDRTADPMTMYVNDVCTIPSNLVGHPAISVPFGVGDDGHIGSLYPDRDEVLDDYAWVLPVEMKDPGSITLSFPVIANAKEVVIAACGVSEKYPQGKSAAMVRAVEAPETLRSFPAAGLRDVATYVFDEAAASKLDAKYRS